MQLARVRRSRGYHALVAIGLVSYGLVHLVVAWIAVQVAFGKRGDASPVGALQTLVKQPLGEILLWVSGRQRAAEVDVTGSTEALAVVERVQAGAGR